jgi:prepilin-type N-terminal cleavage/methylation domain-containing protein
LQLALSKVPEYLALYKDMNRATTKSKASGMLLSGQRRSAGLSAAAFSLIEMLVVLVIITMIAAISLPAIKGLTHSNVMAAASRQLSDDLAFARQTAIGSRTTVYVLFVPPEIYGFTSGNRADMQMIQKLYGKVYTGYALYAERSIGDQPGVRNPRYITEWRSLPEGSFIALQKYVPQAVSLPDVVSPFLSKPGVVFPLVDSPATTVGMHGLGLPCVAFDYTGALIDPVTHTPALQDQVIPLARGSIFYSRDAAGNLKSGLPDVIETPVGNSTNNYTRIRVNWLTGRNRVETPQITP